MANTSSSSIPYIGYAHDIARVASRIRRLFASCPVGFFFLTDLHVPSNHGDSAPLLSRLIAETGIRTVVCGGDIPEAFGNRVSLDDSIARYRRDWVDAIERAGGAFLPIHGNHDFAIRSAPGSDDGYTYPAAETRSILLDTAAVRGRAVVDPGSCAYYADFPEAHVRLVVADTSDRVTQERPYWGLVDGAGEAQVLWIAEHALAGIPDGWGIVFASHIPIAGVGANEADRANFAPLAALLAAYQARGRTTLFGRDIDFSGTRGRIFLALSGHHHAELQSCVGGIWHVTEPCDAAYLDYINRSAPWCPGLPVKEPGTWAGQTFDAVQIDPLRGLAHFTRNGGGSDRTLHLAPLTIRAGDAMHLASCIPALQGMGSDLIAWGAYDADRATAHPNPERRYDYFTDYFNTVATIAQDDTIRALAPGEAVIVARAADGFREYIPLVVS